MRWGAAGIGFALILLAMLALHVAPGSAPLEPQPPPAVSPTSQDSENASTPVPGEADAPAEEDVPPDPWPGPTLDPSAFGLGQPLDLPDPGPPPHSVKISVVDVRGEPLPRARLFIETAEERRCAGRYGEVQWQELPTGVLETGWYPLREPVTVRAAHPHYAGEAEVALTRAEDAADLQLMLQGEPRGALAVQLVPADLEAVPAVTLSLAPAGVGRPRLEGLAAGETWLAGALVPGTWNLVGTGGRGNWRVPPREVEIVAGRTTRLELEAIAAPGFVGIVRDHAGALMPGTQVRVRQPLGLPGYDRHAFPSWRVSWCPSDAVGAGTSVGGRYWAGVRQGEYRARVIVAEDAAFEFPGVTGAPFEVEVVAAVTPDGRIYRSERDPAVPRDTRTRGTVVLRQTVVPGQEPTELRVPARAASVELRLTGEFADTPGITVYVDGAIYTWGFAEREGRRLRLAAMDVGTHSVLVRAYRGFTETAAYAVTEVDCRPGETTRKTLPLELGAELVCDAVRGADLQESTALYLWFYWRGRPLMQQQVYWDSRKHHDAPIGLDLRVRLDAFIAGELHPVERRVQTTRGGTHDLGQLVARARPEIDRRWWLRPRQR